MKNLTQHRVSKIILKYNKKIKFIMEHNEKKSLLFSPN